MSTDESTRDTDRAGEHRHAAISNLMVGLLKEYTGRGPTKARTTLGDHVVTCVLEDTLTKGERHLVARGEHRTVLETRRLFQELIREQATTQVEKILDRTVIAFMSDNHIDPDLAVETFVLAEE